MTSTKTIAAKLSVAAVAVSMLFMLVAPAKAQTVEDLQAQIAALMAQINALQATTAGTTVGGSCVSIPAPLTIGSTGANVTALQNFLITAGQVIPAGATGYFGSQTQSALAGWQAANGVSPAVGYYGPITMAAIDAKCVPTTDGGTTDGGDTDGGSTDSMSLSGEGILDDVTIDSASDDEIEEGAEDAEVAEVTFEAVDGDILLSRIDVAFDNSGVDMWDVLEEVTLWVDGDKVASKDASDEDDFQSDEETLRFSGVDIVVEEDEEVEMVIAVTLQNNIDSDDLSATSGSFNVSVDSVRYFDADDVAETETGLGDLTSDVTFDVVEAGTDDELIVKTSSSDPDATTLQVEDDSKSDWYTVFVFDLDTDDSVNDIELNEVPVSITVSSGTVALFVDDAELVIDGVTIDDFDVDTGTSTVVYTFDVDGDVTIDAGDRVKAELNLRFKSLDASNEGTTVMAEVTSANADAIDAEGADTLEATSPNQLQGAASGEEHTLRTSGIDTTMTDDSAAVTTGDNNDDDYATFEIEVEVTAFEQDAFIPTDASTIDVDIQNSNGSTASSSPIGLVLTSSADEQSNRFEITEGSTETITIQVTYGPDVAGESVRMVLNSIGFYEAPTGGTLKTQSTLPATDYRTGVVTIVN